MYKNLIRSCKLVMLMSLVFALLTGLAMFTYPGGSKFDRLSLQYDFFQNFFSDLGSTVTYSGKANALSNIFFITALSGFGISLIYFSRIWRAIDTDVHKFKSLGYISNLFLIITGLGFMGIAITPWNKYMDYHMFFIKATFVSLLCWTFIIIILQLRNHKMRGLVMNNVIFFLILLYYVTLLFKGPKIDTVDGLQFQAIAQKIIVYLTALNLFIQAFGIKAFLKSSDFRKNGIKNFYV